MTVNKNADVDNFSPKKGTVPVVGCALCFGLRKGCVVRTLRALSGTMYYSIGYWLGWKLCWHEVPPFVILVC